MPNPLENIRVLDLGISTAGPYGARLLGDLGADVIKVEPLAGENTRSLGLRYGDAGYLYHVNNYNKRSISLKVQSERGRKLFLELVALSDVVIENFAIGTMDKWGIGYESCRAANPSIIYCSVKGFGESGPLRDLRAFDTVTQALSGIMYSTGEAGSPPLKGGPSICDLMGAAVSSMAVLSALVARRANQSQLVDTALFDMGALSLMSLWPVARATQPETLRGLGNTSPLHVPYSDYACADGRVMVAVETDSQWKALAPLISLPDTWENETRLERRAQIDAAVAGWLAGRNASAAAQELQEMGVPAAPVLDLGQVASSPHTFARNMIHEVSHPVYGDVPLINTPLADAARPHRSPHRLQPTLGEHNEEIIGNLLGHGAELAVLREAGVIG